MSAWSLFILRHTNSPGVQPVQMHAMVLFWSEDQVECMGIMLVQQLDTNQSMFEHTFLTPIDLALHVQSIHIYAGYL